MADGSRRALNRIIENVWGTTPSTPTLTPMRNTGGDGLKLARGSLVSAEMRNDRQIPFLRLGNKRSSLNLPFELSHGSHDDEFSSVMFNTWKAALSVALSVSCTVEHDDSSYTRASGSFISDGFAVGDRISVTGFVETANNVVGGVITALTATKLTIGGATLTDEVLATGGTFARRKQICTGTTEKSLTVEESFGDLTTPLYRVATGLVADQLSLEIQPEKMITGAFQFTGKGRTSLGTSSIASAVNAAATSEGMDSFTGTIKEGGAVIGYLTGLNLSVANGVNPKPVLGSSDAYRLGKGRSNVTGSVSFYLIDATLANKFDAETETSLEIECVDNDSHKFVIYLPGVKYVDQGENFAEDDISITMSFQAYRQENALTNLIFEVE